MPNSFFCSDHHLGHSNIITFLDCAGKNIRKFDSIEEHDETIIEKHNAVVRPQDRVYFLGDVAIARRNIKLVERMNGKKILIKGNHDIFKLNDYVPLFEDIRAYKVFPTHGIICSHIPIHKENLQHRFKANVHGHLHANTVTKWDVKEGIWLTDSQYLNVCMEQINYTPISLDQVLEKLLRDY